MYYLDIFFVSEAICLTLSSSALSLLCLWRCIKILKPSSPHVVFGVLFLFLVFCLLASAATFDNSFFFTYNTINGMERNTSDTRRFVIVAEDSWSAESEVHKGSWICLTISRIFFPSKLVVASWIFFVYPFFPWFLCQVISLTYPLLFFFTLSLFFFQSFLYKLLADNDMW